MESSTKTGSDIFPRTRWSQVLLAQGDDTQSSEALNDLCRTYWQPVYGYIRRKSANPDEAQDLTQDYFASLLRREYLKKARQEIGRLRAFLLADIKLFLASARRSQSAEKRGGRAVIVPLDVERAEVEHQTTLHAGMGDEHAFDRSWATGILERARQRLGDEYTATGRGAIHEALSPWLDKSPTHADYEKLAIEAGVASADTAKVALSRMRSRLGASLREVVRDTLADPGDTEEEMRYLFAVLAGAE